MNYSRMRTLIECYFLNIRERNRILTDYADPLHAQRKRRNMSCDRFKTSKTERDAMRNIARDNEVAYVTQKIEKVDKHLYILNEEERKIINYIKYGDKIASISRTTGIERRKVAKIRDNAINKMVDLINKNSAID